MSRLRRSIAQAFSLLASLFHHPRPDDLHLVHRLILATGLHQPHTLNDPHTTLDAAKDGVFPIQPRRRSERDEELTAVGIGSAVGHAQDSRTRVFEVGMDLVFEFLAVDGAASSAGAGGITGLDHKVGDDAVEDDIVVVSALREGREILACLGGPQSVHGTHGAGYSRSSDLRRMGVVELDGEGALRGINQWQFAEDR